MHFVNQAFALDQYKPLFKDEAAFLAFADALASAAKKGSTILLSRGEVVGSVLSAAGTKELLYERFIKKISEKPELLAEIAERLENDEIVE